MIIAATMDPEPKKLKQNVSLKFRNLKVTTTELSKRKKIDSSA